MLQYAKLDNANPLTLDDNGKYAVIYHLEDDTGGDREPEYKVHIIYTC